MQQHEASGEKVQIFDIYFYYSFIYCLKLNNGKMFGNTKIVNAKAYYSYYRKHFIIIFQNFIFLINKITILLVFFFSYIIQNCKHSYIILLK